ncbi:MAG: hypothetical protein WBC78_06020 [Candidatus Sulfotelmatobacter sp.]
MTIRQFLRRFLRNGSNPYRDRASEEITGPAVSCRPGIHQPIEKPDTDVFTDEDREFLRQLDIRICSDGTAGEHIGNSRIPDEKRRTTAARA